MDRAHGPLRPLLKRDRELEAGARAHFDDPQYYAETYDWRDEDVLYYVDVAKARGSVLEYGVGNGRVALPMARAGVQVCGVDHSAPMLEHLRTRLRAEPAAVRRRVKAIRGDMRTKTLAKRFPLAICPFNAALHLYTRPDVEAWLDRVRTHLTPDGELVFDISMPVAKDLARDPNVAYRIPPFEHPTAGRVRYREHFDYDPARQILFVSMYFEPARGNPGATFMTPLAQRQFYPQEMEALLHYNGWEIRELYGDFARGPLLAASDVMVWHARPRRGKR